MLFSTLIDTDQRDAAMWSTQRHRKKSSHCTRKKNNSFHYRLNPSIDNRELVSIGVDEVFDVVRYV